MKLKYLWIAVVPVAFIIWVVFFMPIMGDAAFKVKGEIVDSTGEPIQDCHMITVVGDDADRDDEKLGRSVSGSFKKTIVYGPADADAKLVFKCDGFADTYEYIVARHPSNFEEAIDLGVITLSEKVDNFGRTDLNLGGIGIDASMKSVIKVKGKPLKKEHILDIFDLIYTYDDLTLYVDIDNVVGLYSESSKSCTPHDICPGDKFEEAVEKLGEFNITGSGAEIVYVFIKPGHCGYHITKKSEFIHSIELPCGNQ